MVGTENGTAAGVQDGERQARSARRAAAGIVGALAALVGLIGAGPARAHWNDKWYWSPERAESKLSTSSRAPVAFNASEVTDIDCLPIGPWIWSDARPRVKLYKHFDCGFTVNWDDGSYRSVERILHVISGQDFVMSTVD